MERLRTYLRWRNINIVLFLLILIGTAARYLVDDYRRREGQLVMVTTDKPISISPRPAFTCSRISRTVWPRRSAAMITLESRTIPTPAGSTACGG